MGASSVRAGWRLGPWPGWRAGASTARFRPTASGSGIPATGSATTAPLLRMTCGDDAWWRRLQLRARQRALCSVGGRCEDGAGVLAEGVLQLPAAWGQQRAFPRLRMEVVADGGLGGGAARWAPVAGREGPRQGLHHLVMQPVRGRSGVRSWATSAAEVEVRDLMCGGTVAAPSRMGCSGHGPRVLSHDLVA